MSRVMYSRLRTDEVDGGVVRIDHDNNQYQSLSDSELPNGDKLTSQDGGSSDDEEDDVFVKGKISSKPLMHPRSKTAKKPTVSVRQGKSCRGICRLLLLVCMCLLLLISLGVFIAYVVLAMQTDDWKVTEILARMTAPSEETIVPCKHIEVSDVWVQGFPKLTTESAARLVDVNKDGVLDVITGFGTGGDGMGVPPIVCTIYFNRTKDCGGGLLALDGTSGVELWRHYSDHELFGVNCRVDFDGDGVKDCLGGGRAGAFRLVSGASGALLWVFDNPQERNSVMNLYTAQPCRDYTQDGVPEVVVIHGGDPIRAPGSKYRLGGRLLLLDGSRGRVLQSVAVPDGQESYYSPQIHVTADGTELVLFGTGGETHAGGFWYIKLDDLYLGDNSKARRLLYDDFKGFMTPPLMVDVTGDGIDDVIIPGFNATVHALDGNTFTVLWRYRVASAETYSTPTAAYYTDDSIPDIMIHYSVGPGFPLYYHSETIILNGTTGRPLTEPVRDSLGSQSSPLTVSFEGRGNDMFLYWRADCEGHEGEGGRYKFAKGTNQHEQSHTNFCKVRYNTEAFSRLMVLSRHVKFPGIPIYYSATRKELESRWWVNTTKEGFDYVVNHPELTDEYEQLSNQVEKALASYGQTRESESENGNQQLDLDKLDDNYLAQVKGLLNSLFDDKFSKSDQSRPLSMPRPRPQRPRPRLPPQGRTRLPPPGRKSYRRPPNYSPDPRDPRDGRSTQQKQKSSHKLSKRASRNTDSSHKYNLVRDQNLVKISKKLEDLLRGIRMKRDLDHVTEGANQKRERRHVTEGDNQRSHVTKRHVGPHAGDGLQRLISTGTLAPTLLSPTHPDYNHTIDVIFSTFWFYPAKTRAILPRDQKCIEAMMANEVQRFNRKSKYYGLDRDGYEHAVEHECLEARHRNDSSIYQSQTAYNPYNVKMGQMTVYRLRLKCSCLGDPRMMIRNSRCTRIRPFDQQAWTGYMGNLADSHWQKPRDT